MALARDPLSSGGAAHQAGGAAPSSPRERTPLSTRTRITGALTALILTLLVVAAPASAVTYPAGFEERTLVAGGLGSPVGVDWTPDGRMVIIDKRGYVRIAQPGASTATTALDISARVNSNHDRGLLGVTVDSQFATNRFVYLLYTYDLNQLAQDGTGQMVSRLERFTLNPDNTMTNGTVLLGSYAGGVCPAPSNTVDCIPSEGLSHSIGTVISAPDGTLWVGSGDAASYSTVDPLALRVYDERSLAGKILHIDRNGRGLATHSFCPTNNDLTQNCTKVFAKGFRNPYRFKLRPNGGLTVGDVGWNTREEVDLIEPTEAGRAWGWPCYEGTVRTPGYRDRSECAAEYAKEGTGNAHQAPDHDYAHSSGASNAVTGGPTYLGTGYPTAYQGDVFFGDASEGWLKRADVDAQGRITSVSNFATDSFFALDLDIGPDGNLTYVDPGWASGTASIRQIVYSAANASPIAATAGTPTSGAAPLTVAFSSAGSRDPDGDALSYKWEFGDGQSSTAANPSHTYTAAGNYTAKLTVSDGRGLSANATVAISAGNSPPTATMTSPAAGYLYEGGEEIALSGTATDAVDGTLGDAAITWNVTLHHGTHTHPYTELTGRNASFKVQADHDTDSYVSVKMTARDSGGLTATRTAALRPRTVNLRFESSPAGAPITYSGWDARPAPFDRAAAVGYRTSVSAVDGFIAADGNRYVFESWSDGGARLHDIAVPKAASTLTANYRLADTSTPAGLVGAWGFDEGAGASVRDTSGEGNDGAISGAAWAQAGRFGKALNFDGRDDWVTVADDASLDLTGPMTLEAWVKPDALTSWDSILMKETPDYEAYALYASSQSPALVPSGWAVDASAYGNAKLPTTGWSHLAFTYDGRNTGLYVNGTLVQSLQMAQTLPKSTQPLRIGGSSVWVRQLFDGLIDEVRIYNRPLTAAEVASDMGRAVNGGTQPPPPPPPDTTPPTARITAPVAGATVSGTAYIAADASDNVGVEAVQFKAGSANVGAPDTSAPYSVSWDTTAVANGNHNLTAVARDAAGNTVTSSPVQMTVSNGGTAPPSGLVGAWSFDEGNGTVVEDRSGAGNDGTVSGASWTTAGRHGGALDFDGVDDWVTVADAPSLDLTGPMTLQAWVKPDTLGTWDSIVMKEAPGDLSYALYATSSSTSRVPGGWLGSSSVWGPWLLPTTAWSHVTFTYDGAVLRLYLNGVLGLSSARTKTVVPSSDPLRIGGSGEWLDEFFDGKIDDVRIYNRALSAAELSADMSKGVGTTAAPSSLVSLKRVAMPTAGAPDIALATAPKKGKKLRAKKLRRVRRPARSGKHPGASKARRSKARRCPARSARRGSARRGSAAKACRRKRGRRR